MTGTHVDLDRQHLTALPAEYLTPDLEGLRACDNHLTALPDALCRLAHLSELHLRDHALTALPESIGRLDKLLYLDLRGNPLIAIPDGLADLPRLEKLDLRWNLVDDALPAVQRLRARGCLVNV